MSYYYDYTILFKTVSQIAKVQLSFQVGYWPSADFGGSLSEDGMPSN